MVSFSLKFNDDNNSLSATNGIPFEELAELLSYLNDAINPGDGSKCTLGLITGGSYEISLFSEDEKWHTNFEVVHKKVEQHSEADLNFKEKRYADKLSYVLGPRLYVQVINKNNEEVAKIRRLDIKKEIKHYFSVTTLSGIVSQLGGKDLTTPPHVRVSGQDYNIYVTSEQDFQLKQYYKTNLLNLRLRQKISIKDNHVISARLLEFKPKSGKLLENLSKTDVSDLNILQGINSPDDIYRKLYGD